MVTEITISITPAKLHELAMLADWQLAEMGIDPQSVSSAVMAIENDRHGDLCSCKDCMFKWYPDETDDDPEAAQIGVMPTATEDDSPTVPGHVLLAEVVEDAEAMEVVA